MIADFSRSWSRAVVLIDPGHGGLFSGYVAHGLEEKAVTLAVGLKLSRELHDQRVAGLMTRRTDHHLAGDPSADLAARFEVERQRRPDLVVSLHCSSSLAAGGLEVVTVPGSPGSARLGSCLSAALDMRAPLVSTREAAEIEACAYMVRGARVPAVLVRLGNLARPDEAQWLGLESVRVRLAQGICSGLLDYLGLQEEVA